MAGGGLAVVLHAVEDPFDHVPPLVRLPVAIPWGRTIPLGRRARRPSSDGSRRPCFRRRMLRELWCSVCFDAPIHCQAFGCVVLDW